jgi:hypothetical protein
VKKPSRAIPTVGQVLREQYGDRSSPIDMSIICETRVDRVESVREALERLEKFCHATRYVLGDIKTENE